MDVFFLMELQEKKIFFLKLKKFCLCIGESGTFTIYLSLVLYKMKNMLHSWSDLNPGSSALSISFMVQTGFCSSLSRICFCRPVMLRGGTHCVFPGHRSAPLPSTHKQNNSIMDEALSFLVLGRTVPSVCGETRSECSYKQLLIHYSFRCFKARGGSYFIYSLLL